MIGGAELLLGVFPVLLVFGGLLHLLIGGNWKMLAVVLMMVLVVGGGLGLTVRSEVREIGLEAAPVQADPLPAHAAPR